MAGTLTVLDSGRTDAHDDQRRRADVAWSVLLPGTAVGLADNRRSASAVRQQSLPQQSPLEVVDDRVR